VKKYYTANILLGLDGSVKLADFGVAGQLTQTVQKCKTFVGTPYWMAPEVISQNEYDNKADIWAIGITCIEMVIGQPPHSKSNPVRALMLIVNGEPPTLPGHFSIQFRNFVASCVEKIPTNRPTATKLLEHAWLSKKVKKNVLLEMKSLHQQNELKGTKNKPDMKNSRENNELDLSYFTFPDVDEKNDTKELNFNLYPTIVEKNPKSLQRSLSSLSQEENFLDMKLARSRSEKEQNVLIRT
ncbi:MAG: serine/threonine protein kinase, STE, PAK/STE20-related, partial [Paramarteilia canceri]